MKIRRLPELHIEGFKEMSISGSPIEYLKPNSIYLPLTIPTEMVMKKEIGDKVKIGEVVMETQSRFPYPVLSPISGTIKGKTKKWHPSNKLVDMLEIENDFKEEIVDDFKNLNPDKMERDELVDLMKRIGLVGMGGAGFPAYAKYQTKEKVDMVIINLAECEPFITCDYTCVLHHAELFIYGLRYLIKAAGTSKAVIAIKDKPMNKVVIDKIKPLLDQNMEIRYLRDVYPAGWERYTVETITGRTYKMLPIEAGAIVSNASTCFSFARVLKEGIAPSVKYVTFTGDAFTNPCNVLAKIGTPIEEIMKALGGIKDGVDKTRLHVISGGPMTGKSMYFTDFVTTPTLGAVIFKTDPSYGIKTPNCLGCGRCCAYCPTFLSPVEIKKALKVGDMDELKKLGATKCIQCGLCSFVCPSRIELTEAVGKAKEMVIKFGRR